MNELLPLFLAGLAFFFIGVAGISSNLRQMSGRSLRQLLARATHGKFWSAAGGFLFGMLTQSSSAVAYILSGMVATGMIPLTRALPVLAWANVGTAVLVFVATWDITVAIFWLLALSGLTLTFKLAGRWAPVAATLFAIGLLFYGLNMMKTAFAPLPAYAGFLEAAAYMQKWTYAPFVLGILLRTLIQSSSAIGVIAITLAVGGLIDEFQAMLLICGCGLGVSLSTCLMSSNLKGIPRQIVYCQAIINAASGLSLAAILVLDRFAGFPLLSLFQEILPGDIEDRIACIYLTLMLGCMGFGLATLRRMPDWLARLSPSTPEQDFSRPEYIHDEALRDPDTAVDLATREQIRVLQILPRHYEALRQASAPKAAPIHEALGQLCTEIEAFLGELISQQLSPRQSREVLAEKRLLEIVRQLEENIYAFTQAIEPVIRIRGKHSLAGNLVESLDTITLTAIDALCGHDSMDLDILFKMTEDRGELMERIRQDLHNENAALEQRSLLQYATSLFERNVWLFRQLGLWLRAREAGAADG